MTPTKLKKRVSKATVQQPFKSPSQPPLTSSWFKPMQSFLSRLKPYLRWLIFGGTLFFLAKRFKDNWQEIVAVHISQTGWMFLALAIGVTLFAHIWSGYVWLLILREFRQSVRQRWGLQIYLTTNIAKYIPGNFWHYYGRIRAVKQSGITVQVATLSVLLEPVLMASAALSLALISYQNQYWALQLCCLIAVVVGIHPRILNPVLKRLETLKFKKQSVDSVPTLPCQLQRYPLKPLLGEVGFVGLRCCGFVLTLLALSPLRFDHLPMLLGSYSLAWLVGLIIPGAPGGLGVFEAMAVALLGQQFSAGILLSAIAFYRLVSIIAETVGAFFAEVDARVFDPYTPSENSPLPPDN